MCGVPRGWETLRPTRLARERLRHPLLFLLEDGVGAPPAVCAARHAVCAADGADNDVNAAPASSNIPPPPQTSISHCLTEADAVPRATEPVILFFLPGDKAEAIKL